MTALLLLVAATSTVGVPAAIEAAIAGEAELPSLARVQEAAVEALELTPSAEVAGWTERTRWRGIVPRLDARFGTDADQRIRDGTTSFTATEAQAFGVQLAARWELGELVFNDMELRANRERIARAARIAVARDRATKLWFARLRVALAIREEPTVERLVRAAELDGMLRAITGGRVNGSTQKEENR